jgi:hypothetical protein
MGISHWSELPKTGKMAEQLSEKERRQSSGTGTLLRPGPDRVGDGHTHCAGGLARLSLGNKPVDGDPRSNRGLCCGNDPSVVAPEGTSGRLIAIGELLEIGLLAAVSIAAAMIGGLAVGASASDPSVPVIAALALVLIPALTAHIFTARAARVSGGNFPLLALMGTGIRLVLTLGGALVLAFTASWGDELAFWVPLAAAYLATLGAELIFTIRKIPNR